MIVPAEHPQVRRRRTPPGARAVRSGRRRSRPRRRCAGRSSDSGPTTGGEHRGLRGAACGRHPDLSLVPIDVHVRGGDVGEPAGRRRGGHVERAAGVDRPGSGERIGEGQPDVGSDMVSEVEVVAAEPPESHSGTRINEGPLTSCRSCSRSRPGVSGPMISRRSPTSMPAPALVNSAGADGLDHRFHGPRRPVPRLGVAAVVLLHLLPRSAERGEGAGRQRLLSTSTPVSLGATRRTPMSVVVASGSARPSWWRTSVEFHRRIVGRAAAAETRCSGSARWFSLASSPASSSGAASIPRWKSTTRRNSAPAPRDARQRVRGTENRPSISPTVRRARELSGLPRPAQLDRQDRAQDAGLQGGLGPSVRHHRHREKFRDHRLELALHEWARFKANDSLECRNCHSAESMDITKQSPRASAAHQRFLFTGEKTCIDCHKGIAHQPPDMKACRAAMTPSRRRLAPLQLRMVSLGTAESRPIAVAAIPHSRTR